MFIIAPWRQWRSDGEYVDGFSFANAPQDILRRKRCIAICGENATETRKGGHNCKQRTHEV